MTTDHDFDHFSLISQGLLGGRLEVWEGGNRFQGVIEWDVYSADLFVQRYLPTDAPSHRLEHRPEAILSSRLRDSWELYEEGRHLLTVEQRFDTFQFSWEGRSYLLHPSLQGFRYSLELETGGRVVGEIRPWSWTLYGYARLRLTKGYPRVVPFLLFALYNLNRRMSAAAE